MSQNNYHFPEHISIIGGGRWARVYAKVLYDLVSSRVKISIHSKSNSDNISDWVVENKFDDKINVSEKWPTFNLKQSNALIVVNAVKDHDKAVQWGMSSGIPVLVEKPMSLSFLSAKRFSIYAKSNKIPFECSNIFLFAKYFESFSEIVKNQSEIKKINFYWKDAKSENRYGEVKRFDPTLYLFSDCLPHILPMINYLVGGVIPKKIEKMEILRGGAKLNLKFFINSIPCFLYLERNSKNRERLIEIDADKKLELDFKIEPGIIRINDVIRTNNYKWEKSNFPLASMLKSFFNKISNYENDSRFDINISVDVCKLTEKLSKEYIQIQYSWLKNKLKKNSEINECDNMLYAINELFQINDINNSEEINKQ